MGLITDGVDTGSKTSKEKAIEASQKADAIIYSIDYEDAAAYGYGGFGRISMGGGGEGDLKRMSSETGGHVYRGDRGPSLDQIFKELQEEIPSQYAIGYKPANPKKEGSFRKLEIRPAGEDLKSRAREGCNAVAGG